MSTKSKNKAFADKAKKDSKQQPQSLLKKAVSTVKSTIMGKASKTEKVNGIYVKGISHAQSLDEIKRIFGSAGTITGCRRRSDKYALLWFADQNSVKRAIDMFHHKSVENFSAEGRAAPATTINEKYRKYYTDLYAASKRNVSTLKKYIVRAARAAPPAARSTYCKTVFVSGLPNAKILSNGLLRAAFSKYGKVVKMTRYNSTQFTFVYYAEVASAVKAQADMNGKGLANLLQNVEEEPHVPKKGEKKKEAKPFVLPKPDHPLKAELSIRTKERDEIREVAARKHSKHKEEHKKWVRGTGF